MRCINCMSDIGKEKICPHCGLNEKQYNAASYVLPARTVLRNRYMVGSVQKEDENGITYQGWDMNDNVRVLIWEYFQRMYVSRGQRQMVVPYHGCEAFFEKRKSACLARAKELNGFRPLDSLLLWEDLILENNTIYMIMPYAELETLEEFLGKNGCMTEEEFFDKAKSVIGDLCRIHKEGLVHTAIHPGSLGFVKAEKLSYCFKPTKGQLRKMKQKVNRGGMKLAGWEAAGGNISQKYEAYAPIECIHDVTECSAQTDIYGLCSAAYCAVTGREPAKAYDRLVYGKTNMKYAENGAELTQMIQKGMEIFPKDRWSNLSEYADKLYKKTDMVKQKELDQKRQLFTSMVSMYNEKKQTKTAQNTDETMQKVYEFGEQFYFGTGVAASRDEKNTFTCYQTAAEAGHAHAQCCLGVCYYLGIGTEADTAKARKWMRAAAEQGNLAARTNLYLWYRNTLDPLQEKSFALRPGQLERIHKLCREFVAAHGQEWLDTRPKLIQTLGIRNRQVFLSYDVSVWKNGKSGFAVTDDGVYVSTGLRMSYENFAKGSELKITTLGVQAGNVLVALCQNMDQKKALLRLYQDIRFVLLCM